MIKSLAMVVLFYLTNFKLWDFFVNRHILNSEWASFAVYTILFVIALLFFKQTLLEQWQRLRKQINSAWRFLLQLFLWSLLGSLLTTVCILIFGTIFSLDLVPENQENISDMVERIPLILSFVMMAIYAPIIEELTFRHAIIGNINRHNTFLLIVATITSVLLFDFLHVIHLPEFWYYLPMAVLLTAMYWRYDRNVCASIIFHSFFNSAGFLLMVTGNFI